MSRFARIREISLLSFLALVLLLGVAYWGRMWLLGKELDEVAVEIVKEFNNKQSLAENIFEPATVNDLVITLTYDNFLYGTPQGRIRLAVASRSDPSSVLSHIVYEYRKVDGEWRFQESFHDR